MNNEHRIVKVFKCNAPHFNIRYSLFDIRYSIFLILIFACNNENPINQNLPTNTSNIQLFQERIAEETGLDFENSIIENNRINILNYLYYYNGSGVAVGDINNDDLPDIYFAATTGKNKLFLNKGKLQFEDISLSAGVAGDFGITTGVNFIDINNDGWLDIYVCKSGMDSERYRTNQLFINNGNLTFSEKAAEYGLDDASFSNQAYFFDMDADEDLDMYLVNHPIDWPNINKIMTGKQNEDGFHYEFSDKLYRNNGNGKFEDVTQAAGILNRAWGLSAAIGDFNDDNLPDIYVANDFIKPDLLYINQGDGTFKDELQKHFRHISFYSMGTDYADINNDGKNDLYVADMAMNGHVRSKRNMGSMSTENFQTIIRRGYHYPYSSNTLQLNVGQNSFADIAQAAGVAKTDWSWSPLLMDYDNDGYKDIFVTNGIYRDIIDNDFLAQKASYDEREDRNYFDDLLSDIPQTKVSNFLFRNQGDLSFSNQNELWGIESSSNSNGAAYADLDLDGDLDLVVNNLNEPSIIYENLCDQKISNNYLKVKLFGAEQNKNAIGASVTIFYGEEQQRIDMQPARGYLSTVDYSLHFGLGIIQQVDVVQVRWPDGKQTEINAPKINQTLVVDYKQAKSQTAPKAKNETYFEDQTAFFQLQYQHQEKDYDDFAQELLLPHKLSENGPFLSVADVNADGLEDFYIGGAAGFAGTLYLQQSNDRFVKSSEAVFTKDQKYEDQKSLFFDADQDGDLDLYVVSGSNEFAAESRYQDRLYLNDGQGNFSKATDALPEITASGSAVAASDIDSDGDLDLVIGGRLVAGKYPSPPRSYLLENQSGKFTDITEGIAPDFVNIGMITDVVFSDYDQDGDEDLIVVGEWMPVTIFDNENGQFSKSNTQQFSSSNGWWQSITAADLDADGDDDYILGNIGKNNKYHPKVDKPLYIYYNDFDENGTGDIVLSKKDQGELVPLRGRECSSQQMPFIADKFEDFSSFANASMNDIYDTEKLQNALQYKVYEFASLLLKNQGKGEFKSSYLPNEAQLSPLLGSQVLDLDQDGHLDIVGAGNFFASETETIRYDAGSGFVLRGDETGRYQALTCEQSGLMLKENVRDIQLIKLSGERQGLLVASNRAKLKLLVVNPVDL